MTGTDGQGSGVEFLDEPSDAPAEPGEVGARGRHRQQLAVGVLLGAVAVAVVVDLAAHHARDRPAQHRAVGVSVAPHPSPTPTQTCAPGQCGAVPSAPSAGVAQAFATTIPGSLAVSEDTATQRGAGGRLVVQQRVIQAVSGNVEITLTIARATGHLGPPPRNVTQLASHGYVFDFRFAGFYPPTRAQLHQLSADGRLVSTRA